MSKQARRDNKLAEQAAIAGDISAMASRKFQVAGVEIMPATIRTSMGPAQGATIIIHMADGRKLEPFTLDPIGIIALIAGTSTVLAGAGQEPPAPEPLAGEQPATLATLNQEPTILPSGLIVP